MKTIIGQKYWLNYLNTLNTVQSSLSQNFIISFSANNCFFLLLLFKAEKWFANILFLNGTACNTDTITFQHAVWNPRSRIAYWYSICRLCNLLGEHAINENLNEIKRVKLKRAMFSFCKQVQETTVLRFAVQHITDFFLFSQWTVTLWLLLFTFSLWLTPWLQHNDELRQIWINPPGIRVFSPFHSSQLSFFLCHLNQIYNKGSQNHPFLL